MTKISNSSLLTLPQDSACEVGARKSNHQSHKPTNIFATKEWQEYDYYKDLVEDEELAEVKPVGKEWLSWHTPWYLCEKVKLHPKFITLDGVFLYLQRQFHDITLEKSSD